MFIAIDKKPAMPAIGCKGNTASRNGKQFCQENFKKKSFWKTFWTRQKFNTLTTSDLKIILENFSRNKVDKNVKISILRPAFPPSGSHGPSLAGNKRGGPWCIQEPAYHYRDNVILNQQP